MYNKIWGGARVVEWGRLLSGYRGEILGRRFESCPPRHSENAFLIEERVFNFGPTFPQGDGIRILSSPPKTRSTLKVFLFSVACPLKGRLLRAFALAMTYDVLYFWALTRFSSHLIREIID